MKIQEIKFSPPNPGRRGRLITNGVHILAHELAAYHFLCQLGKTLELILPSNTPGSKNPDLVMDGVIWELKSPTGQSLRTIQRILHKAGKQAENVILDLRRTRQIGDHAATITITAYFQASRRLRRVLVILPQSQKAFYYKK